MHTCIHAQGPELLDSYIGESERNIRELFEHAKQIAPCVLFFDEIDSIAPARAKNNDSSCGVMDRIVSQLLTEIDMIAAPTNTPALSSDSSSVETTGSIVTDKLVFVIAATNRPDLLDSALLRPGRFDRKIYLGVCEVMVINAIASEPSFPDTKLITDGDDDDCDDDNDDDDDDDDDILGRGVQTSDPASSDEEV